MDPRAPRPSAQDERRRVSELAGRAREEASAERERYAGDEERPLGGYVGVLGVYTLVMAVAATLLRRSSRRLPERFDARDLALVTVATHKVARLLAKEPVTSPLRAPFTRFEGTSGPAELAEEVRGGEVRKAVGELLTCPFCVGHWVATGFAFGLVVAPRPTRFLASVFTVLSGSDALQLAYAAMQRTQER